jgi:hypothetical protein
MPLGYIASMLPQRSIWDRDIGPLGRLVAGIAGGGLAWLIGNIGEESTDWWLLLADCLIGGVFFVAAGSKRFSKKL